MTIRNLWDMCVGWKLYSKVCVYKRSELIYEGSFRRMQDCVLDAEVALFDVMDNGLTIFIMVIE